MCRWWQQPKYQPSINLIYRIDLNTKSMYTIKSPDNFSSFAESVEFTVTTDDSSLSSVVVTLVDAMTEQVISSRRLPLCEGSATTDFAPLLRRIFALQPVAGATGLAAEEECNAHIKLKVGSVVSPVITCVAAPHEGLARCITTMPVKRRIGIAECDSLLMFLPERATISLDAVTPSGVDTQEFMWEGDGGMVALRVRMSDFSSDTEQITARLNGVVVAEWQVEPSSEVQSVRLAWRTPHGSLEHYTFPAIDEQASMVERQSIRTEGGVVTTSIEHVAEMSVSSRYEPLAMVAALSGILSSPQVWVVDDDGSYSNAEVESCRCTVHESFRPSKISLKIHIQDKTAW